MASLLRIFGQVAGNISRRLYKHSAMASLRGIPSHRSYIVTPSMQSIRTRRQKFQFTKPSLVIFDKDGTLICSHAMWTPWVTKTAARFEASTGHKNLSEKIYHLLDYDSECNKVKPGLLAQSTMPIIKQRLTDLLEMEGKNEAEAKTIVDECWEECETGSSVSAFGDLPRLMQKLKEEDIKIAVCTADSRKGTLAALTELGLIDLVDEIVCGDDPGTEPKPSPRNAQILCERFGIDPSQAMMVGDTLADTGMGRTAGLGCIVGVLTGVCSVEQLQPEADIVVDSVHDVFDIFMTETQFMKSHTDIDQEKVFARSYSTLRPTIPSSAPVYNNIILGAGSAGCVLANRLSEDKDNSVLLLESGPKDNPWNWKIHMPAALMYNLCDDKYNWFYTTEPQKAMNNRQMYWPRGRVWGGSSSLNAMVYIRGHAYDYDRWQNEGADGWSYADCLPYFKKAQTHELGADDYRGGDGPLHVSRGKTNNPLFKAFIEAGVQAGYPVTEDMNGYQQEGVGYMDMTIHNGKRWNTSSAYLRPVLHRPNLKAESKTMVTRILFEGSKAVGVEYLQNGVLHKARVTKDIILCSGAINSPQTLMLSGIGNADELRQLGIPVVANLPGVGENLQDHLEVYVQQKCKKPITLYTAQWKFPWNMVGIGLEWFLFRTGKAASAHLEAGGFIRTHQDVEHPDIQFHFLPSVVNDHGRKSGDCHAYQLHVGTLRSKSVGYVKLRSDNPNEHPIIQPNYMSHEQDWEEMRYGIRSSREIFAQKAFDTYRDSEIQPGAELQSDKELDEYIAKMSDSAYHPSCTCKMGSDADSMAVVDNHTRVIGVDNLRVVDASIMPSIVSGNLNAPTIMIAEKAADIIRGKSPLPPLSDVPVWKPESQDTLRRKANSIA